MENSPSEENLEPADHTGATGACASAGARDINFQIGSHGEEMIEETVLGRIVAMF